jgi:hypothetical protein
MLMIWFLCQLGSLLAGIMLVKGLVKLWIGS